MQALLAEEPDGGNLLVRIRRGARGKPRAYSTKIPRKLLEFGLMVTLTGRASSKPSASRSACREAQSGIGNPNQQQHERHLDLEADLKTVTGDFHGVPVPHDEDERI